MVTFNKKKELISTFAERLNAAKSVFKKSYDDAIVLQGELCKEIEERQSEINNLKSVEKDTLKFISNISKIIE